jgi:hypothetical protein
MPVLSADKIHVIDGDVPFVLLAVPADKVKIVGRDGPVTIVAKFLDGNGEFQDKTYTGKKVYYITAVGNGQVELLAIPNAFQTVDQIKRRTIDVDAGQGPRPPPDPKPPGPDPTDKGPFNGAAGLHVLILYESGKNLNRNQHSIIYGKLFRDFVTANAPQRWRIWDKDLDVNNDAQVWKDAMNRSKAKQKELPWIAVGSGPNWWEGPLPETDASTIKLLQWMMEGKK